MSKRRSQGIEEATGPIIAAGVPSVLMVHLTPRLALDLVVDADDRLMTFVRLDGELVAELHVLGQA